MDHLDDTLSSTSSRHVKAIATLAALGLGAAMAMYWPARTTAPVAAPRGDA